MGKLRNKMRVTEDDEHNRLIYLYGEGTHCKQFFFTKIVVEEEKRLFFELSSNMGIIHPPINFVITNNGMLREMITKDEFINVESAIRYYATL